MPIATYKDLCIDAVDPFVSGEFWAAALGWDLHRLGDGNACLKDGSDVRVWLNRVPETKTVKNRVHLDVNTEDIDRLLAAGATVVDADNFPWTILADPDGQELCGFVRAEPVTQRLYELVWATGDSAADSHRIAAFWADVLGGQLVDDDGYSYVEQIPDAPFESLDFVPVPEPKTVKNRVHIDVTTDDVEALLAAGATRLRAKGDGGIGWDVLADPDGNEFCAFTAS